MQKIYFVPIFTQTTLATPRINIYNKIVITGTWGGYFKTNNMKTTAMQMMLDDLLAKRDVYENAKMYECVATLETSIEIAEYLLEKEKEQIIESHKRGSMFNGWALEHEHKKYYNQTYNQNK